MDARREYELNKRASSTKIRKRNGAVEIFDSGKVFNSVRTAGASRQEAYRVTRNVTRRVSKLSEVPTTRISDMVSRSLSQINPLASSSFREHKWKRLEFEMQPQEQTNWCWAATTASVSYFFNPNSHWGTQCNVVNTHLGRTDACTNGSSSLCNKTTNLQTPLKKAGHLRGRRLTGRGLWSSIKREIDSNRPLCVRVQWEGGGGHFLAIDGYHVGLNMVAIDDPWYGASDVSLPIFQSKYLGAGSWSHSYLVKP